VAKISVSQGSVFGETIRVKEDVNKCIWTGEYDIWAFAILIPNYDVTRLIRNVMKAIKIIILVQNDIAISNYRPTTICNSWLKRERNGKRILLYTCVRRFASVNHPVLLTSITYEHQPTIPVEKDKFINSGCKCDRNIPHFLCCIKVNGALIQKHRNVSVTYIAIPRS
jgi:hypothetical protein